MRVSNAGGSADSPTTTLTVRPDNDDFANAYTVDPAALPYSRTQNSINATDEAGEQTFFGCMYNGIPNYQQPTSGSLWWNFTPTVSGIYQIDTIGSAAPANNTRLSVWTGNAVNALVQVACDDDAGGNYNSKLTLALTAGTTYRIRSADWAFIFDAGQVVLNVQRILPVVSIAAQDATASEAPDTGTFRITRTGDTTFPLTVTYTVGGSASQVIDYSPFLNGTVIIPANQAFVDLVVTPINDQTDETDETVELTLTDGSDYDLDTITTATVTIADDDTAGVLVDTSSLGALPEDNTLATTSFSIMLQTPPTSSVSISLSTDGQCSLSSDTVILPANAIASQLVSVTAINDASVETASHVCHITTGDPISGDGAYNNLGAADVNDVDVSILDNDIPFTITSSASPVSEGTGANTTVTFTVTPGDAIANVGGSVTYTLTDTTGTTTSDDFTAALTGGTLTFAQGSGAQNVTITVIGDVINEPDFTLQFAITGVTAGTSGTASSSGAPASVTVNDDDTAGIILTPSGGSTDVTDGGATDDFTIVLTSQPTSDVTITVAGDAQASVTNTPPLQLTFSSANWNQAQMVTVTAVDDAVVEGAHSGSVTFSVSSADTDYSAFSLSPVFVSITDNDNAAITVTPSGGSTDVTEGGATDDFTIVLTSQPTSDVTITVAGDSQASVTNTPPLQLTFSAANWNQALTVTVTAVDDAVVEGAHSGSVTFSVSSADTDYSAFSLSPVFVSITDNDNAGVFVDPLALTTGEDGTAAQFNVRLFSQPTSDVTITLNGVDATEGTLDITALIFTSASWADNQTITVTGVNDDQDDGNVIYTITTTIATSDTVYAPIDPADVQVTNTDDDSAGLTVTPPLFQLTEGLTGSYTIHLLTPPTAAPITVLVEFPTDQLIVNGNNAPFMLTFTDTTPQTIPFSVLTTLNINTSREISIRHTVIGTSAVEYPIGTQAVVTLSIYDTPPPPPSPTCDTENQNPDAVVRTGVPDTLAYAINCRVLYHNGGATTWLGSPLYSEANLGIAGLLDLGVQQAVDIFSPPPSSLTYFEGGFVMCLRGEGTLIWMAASRSPRVAEIIGSYTVPEFPGFTCTSIFEPGTLILVSENPITP